MFAKVFYTKPDVDRIEVVFTSTEAHEHLDKQLSHIESGKFTHFKAERITHQLARALGREDEFVFRCPSDMRPWLREGSEKWRQT